MRLTITIDTSNDVFQPETAGEVSRILSHLAREIEGESMGTGWKWILRDLNGNKVGEATYV